MAVFLASERSSYITGARRVGLVGACGASTGVGDRRYGTRLRRGGQHRRRLLALALTGIEDFLS